jgi:hypothetical protein
VEPIQEALCELQQFIVGEQALAGTKPIQHFIQIGLPQAWLNKSEQLAADTERVWHHIQSLLPSKPSPKVTGNPPTLGPFLPYPRMPYQFTSRVDPMVCVPIAGLTASYLTRMVPCDILSSAASHHEDYWAMVLLTELLTRNEGPLFSAIRGHGYAYDSGLALYLWAGQMVFDLVDSNAPSRALEAFYEVLERWAGDGWRLGGHFTELEFQAAKCGVLYRLRAELSTVGGILSSSLRAVLRVCLYYVSYIYIYIYIVCNVSHKYCLN